VVRGLAPWPDLSGGQIREDSRTPRPAACRPRVRPLVPAVIVGPVTDGFDRKQKLLEAELWRYFGETCPELVARWQAAITGLAPPFLRELAARLQELDEVTQRINRQLRAALRPVAEGASTEPVIDQALASLEHLNEIAESMRRRLDELLTAA
jgi:hypothetical protein